MNNKNTKKYLFKNNNFFSFIYFFLINEIKIKKYDYDYTKIEKKIYK